MSWERSAAIAGLSFIALQITALALGTDAGASDREVLDYYSDSGSRAEELAAFFLVAAAGLSYLVFAVLLRSLIVREETGTGVLAALTLASGASTTALVIFFVGYLVLMLWVLTVSVALLLRSSEAGPPPPG